MTWRSHGPQRGILTTGECLSKAAKTRRFRAQKAAELLRIHIVDIDALLGKGIANLRLGQNFSDFLSRRVMIGAGVPPVVMMHIQLSI